MAPLEDFAPYETSTLSEEESNRLNDPNRTFNFDDGKGASLEAIADRAMPSIRKMLESGVRARQTRFESIRKNEDMYNGNTPPALRGRSNIPFDCLVMGGFLDTLMAGTDEPLDITYGPTEERATKAAKKMTALFKDQTGPNKGNWDDQIYNSKFLAGLSGRGFAKLYIENSPKFSTDLSVPDHYDMVTEPQGGAYLDKHIFKFEMNIFRSKAELLDGMRGGIYNPKRVTQLIGRYLDPTFKKNDDIYRNKLARFATFGVDIESEGYIGQSLYRLVEGVVSINHQWYYILFSYETQTWIRFDKLENVFAWASDIEGRGPWVSYATHRHPFVFWTKAPADDIRAIGYTMKKILNLTVDNLEKRNWNMQAYDPRIFTDPEKLLYKQDNLVRATLKQGQKLGDGIFQFKTEDTTGITINLMQYLDVFLGKKTGITDDQQGDSNEAVLGIQVNNIAQASKRLKLTNRQFGRMGNDLGVMFDLGVYGRLRESVAVKLIGAQGADWDETFTREDAAHKFTIQVRAGVDDVTENVVKVQKRSEFFTAVETNPTLAGKVNPTAFVRFKARDAGFEEDQIDELLDVKNESDADVLADAAQAIDDCINGKPYRLYQDANLSFVQKIIDFANKHYQVMPTSELKKLSTAKRKEYQEDMKEFDKLMALAKAHLPYVKKNAARDIVATQGMPAPVQPNRIKPDMMSRLQPQDSGPGAPETMALAAAPALAQ